MLLMEPGWYHLAWKLKIPSPVPGSSVFLALQAFPHLWIKDSSLWPLTSMRIVMVNMIIKARVSLSHWKMNDPLQPKDTQTEAKHVLTQPFRGAQSQALVTCLRRWFSNFVNLFLN